MRLRLAPLVAGFVAAVVLAAAAVPVCAQPVPDYDFEWSMIGAPGNRAANAQEAPFFYLPPPLNPPGGFQVGAVNYEYRLSRTEVTTAQWFEFVQAYTPYYTGGVNDPAFTSLWIEATNFEPGQDPGYTMAPGTELFAAGVAWRYAARYVNWLHNDKSTEQWAFETGAYDTSTFTENTDGSFNDQLTHHADARFWIPTLDEWIKGMHFDPHKYGEGQEGYWMYPHRSDQPPIAGYPEEGGESLAGVPLFAGPELPVGAYSSVFSPWDLLDGSGSVTEWTEFAAPDSSRRIRVAEGNQSFGAGTLDRLDRFGGGPADFRLFGLRVASQVPSPSGFVFIALTVLVCVRKRREHVQAYH